MKITKLETRQVSLPFAKPITTAIHDMRSVGCVLLSLHTNEGLVGEAYLFTLNGAGIKNFDLMIRSFKHLVVGRDPYYITAIWEDIWAKIDTMEDFKMAVSALSTIDTACWDLIGKAANKPLHHVFGACRDRIPTYASGGLWLSQSIDELQAEVKEFLDAGFRCMKIRVGSEKHDMDIERVKAVREVVGAETGLMVDVNQGLSVEQAINLGRELARFDLIWLEEPVAAEDHDGHARVTAALDIPVASGENEYARFSALAMMVKKGCDIFMPDLQRIGGLTEMRRVAELAHAHNMPVSTHIFTEQSLSIAGSAPNCISVEHMPWFCCLFNEEMVIDNGDILIPDRPGTGFSFNQDYINSLIAN